MELKCCLRFLFKVDPADVMLKKLISCSILSIKLYAIDSYLLKEEFKKVSVSRTNQFPKSLLFKDSDVLSLVWFTHNRHLGFLHQLKNTTKVLNDKSVRYLIFFLCHFLGNSLIYKKIYTNLQ